MKKLISNEHSMNSNEIVALSMLKLYFTSVETEMRKQWKQRVMKCKNEEILIDGNSLLTLLENAKCYAVMVLEEKKEEAVGYVILELCVAYLVMYFLIPYVRRKTRFVELPLGKAYLEKFGIIKAGIVFLFVFVLIVNPPIRDMLFNLNITSEAVSGITYTMAEYRSQIPGEYLIGYYLGIVVIYVQLLRIIKESKSLPNWIRILFIIIASLAYAWKRRFFVCF